MIKLKIFILILILLLSSMPFFIAKSANAAPSGIIYQAPITIDNNQSSATSNPFQQMIKIPISQFSSYIFDNNTSANFEFYYANNTIIPAWIESVNSSTIVVWLKIYSIPASSSITIYIGFASKSTNLLSSSGTIGIGEAPQLSSTYAEYDDGDNVFNFYDNFAGTSLNISKWTESSNGASYTVGNGLTVKGDGNGVQLHGKVIQNYPSIFDVYIASYTTGISQIRNGFCINPNATSINGFNTNYDLLTAPDLSGDENLESTLGGFGVAIATITYPSNYIQSFAWISTGSELAQVNYANTLTGSNTEYTIANYYPAIWFIYSASGSYTTVSYWVRTRAYPPNGVMPSVEVIA